MFGACTASAGLGTAGVVATAASGVVAAASRPIQSSQTEGSSSSSCNSSSSGITHQLRSEVGARTPLARNARETELEPRRNEFIKSVRAPQSDNGFGSSAEEAEEVDFPLKRLFFRWWGSSCHFHTLFEGVVFAIIESGHGDVFQSTVYGRTLIDAFTYSRDHNAKHHVSTVLRRFLHGSIAADAGSVFKGGGHGDGSTMAGAFFSLSTSLRKIFDPADSWDFEPRFLRTADSSLRCAQIYQCSNCRAGIDTSSKSTDEHRCVWTLNNVASFSGSIRSWARDKCQSCHKFSARPVVSTPTVLIGEIYQDKKCAQIGVSSSFSLEIEISISGDLYSLVSVCFSEPLHFTCDALRKTGDGLKWCQIDDIAGRPTRIVEPPTSKVGDYHNSFPEVANIDPRPFVLPTEPPR